MSARLVACSEHAKLINQLSVESTRTFVKGLDRKQRFDINKNGLEIKAVCVGTEKESSTAADNTKTTVA